MPLVVVRLSLAWPAFALAMYMRPKFHVLAFWFTATPRGPEKLLYRLRSLLIWVMELAPTLNTTMAKLVCAPRLNVFLPTTGVEPRLFVTVPPSKTTFTSVAGSFSTQEMTPPPRLVMPDA